MVFLDDLKHYDISIHPPRVGRDSKNAQNHFRVFDQTDEIFTGFLHNTMISLVCRD